MKTSISLKIVHNVFQKTGQILLENPCLLMQVKDREEITFRNIFDWLFEAKDSFKWSYDKRIKFMFERFLFWWERSERYICNIEITSWLSWTIGAKMKYCFCFTKRCILHVLCDCATWLLNIPVYHKSSFPINQRWVPSWYEFNCTTCVQPNKGISCSYA